MKRKSFYCKDGKLAFFVPFTFLKDGSFWDGCFNEEDLKSENSEIRKKAYREGKENVIGLLQSENETLFKDAQICFGKCPAHRGGSYSGAKNLCSCLETNNKFHDDASQKALRTEMFLGNYTAVYEYAENSNTVSFSFGLDIYLSINKEDNVCFLILKTGLESFKNDGLFKSSGDIILQMPSSSGNIYFTKTGWR